MPPQISHVRMMNRGGRPPRPSIGVDELLSSLDIVDFARQQNLSFVAHWDHHQFRWRGV